MNDLGPEESKGRVRLCKKEKEGKKGKEKGRIGIQSSFDVDVFFDVGGSVGTSHR